MTPPEAAAPAIARPYRPADDADWWAIRELLVRTHAASPPGWNWDIRRWDGSRFHNDVPVLPDAMAAGIGMWESADGRLVGAVHGEGGPGEAYLELDPDWRHLQPAMLEWAEAHLAVIEGGRRVLEVPAWDDDLPLRALLRERGYEEREAGTWLRRLRFGASGIEAPDVAPGYGLRATAEATLDADCARMAALLNASFGRTVHTAAEYRTFATRSPSFRHDLNLVVIAPGGSIAAHAGFTLDEANRHGIIEPVCTHPAHRQVGLGRALILEGLGRLRDVGAATCDVETGDMVAANALYRSIGFTEEYRGHRWRKDLGAGTG
ncbi:MAG TPA: GNAT family N-acetyltransferase [Candidatus Limnocylindrales bacterium]|nr:GNAT family N-acetyltransferase [Candidatus Limnocylindrales bacterium]